VVSFYFYCKEVNILYCLAFSVANSLAVLFIELFIVELFVVKICVICAHNMCWFDNVNDPLRSI